MADFFAELKRRHVYRVAGAYVVAAWLILQVVNNIAPAFNLSGSAVMLVIVLLCAGFPIALILAWAFDIKATAPSDPLAVKAKTTGFDFVLIGGFAMVIGIFLYQQFAPALGERAAQQTVGTSGVRPAQLGISIAVLPFTNMSGDATQEFFSDGMTEEITSALAKVPDLRVVARTSAFQFKAQNRDIQSIGQQLHATHFIEGSVRKAGDRLRITAQLIKSDDGTRIWSESYDRELTDVFAIQENIARAIIAALPMPLGLREADSLVPSRTSDLEVYQAYLRAKELVRNRGAREPEGPLTEAADLLEKAVNLDPSFAPAQALLAEVDVLLASYKSAYFVGSDAALRDLIDGLLEKGGAAAKEAVRLDDNSVYSYASLGAVQFSQGKIFEAEQAFIKARTLDRHNTDVLHFYSLLLGNVGHLNEALALRQQLSDDDPLVTIFNAYSADFFWLTQKNAAALEIFRSLPAGNPFVARQVSLLYGAEGKYSEAAEALRKASPAYDPKLVELASQLLLSVNGQSPLQGSPELGFFNLLYVFSNVPDRSLATFEANRRANFWAAWEAPQFWHPAFAAVRKTERFKTLMREAGFVEYWRARGWPDQGCHAVGSDDFACD